MIYYVYVQNYTANQSRDDLGNILNGIGADFVQIELNSIPDMSNRPFSAYLVLSPWGGGAGPSIRAWVHARLSIVGHRADIRDLFGRIKNNYSGYNTVSAIITDAPAGSSRLSIAIGGERIPSADDTASDTFAKIQIRRPFYYAFHFLYVRSGGTTDPTFTWMVGSFFNNETVTNPFQFTKVGYGTDYVEMRARQYANTIAVYNLLCKSPITNNP